jgi:hypothetical protein
MSRLSRPSLQDQSMSLKYATVRKQKIKIKMDFIFGLFFLFYLFIFFFNPHELFRKVFTQ